MKSKLTFALILLLAFKVNYSQTFENGKIDIIYGTGIYNVPCVYWTPLGYDPAKYYPLVIFGHGAGEFGNQDGSQISKMYNSGLPYVLKSGYKPSFDFIMIAPQGSSYSASPNWLNAILEEANKKYKIDSTRIYITGLSAGGWITYGSQFNIDTTLAKKIAAIVPLSAATQDINQNNYDFIKTAKTPAWAVVGSLDTYFRDQNIFIINAINARVPGLATITVRSGVGHSGWNDVYNGTVKTIGGLTMWQWLYQFTRTKETTSTIPPVSIPSTGIPSLGFKIGDILKVTRNDTTLFKIKFTQKTDSTFVFDWQN